MLNIISKKGIFSKKEKFNLGKGIIFGDENAPLTPNILLNKKTVNPPAKIFIAIPITNSSDFKSITNTANNSPTNKPTKAAKATPAKALPRK